MTDMSLARTSSTVGDADNGDGTPSTVGENKAWNGPPGSTGIDIVYSLSV